MASTPSAYRPVNIFSLYYILYAIFITFIFGSVLFTSDERIVKNTSHLARGFNSPLILPIFCALYGFLSSINIMQIYAFFL